MFVKIDSNGFVIDFCEGGTIDNGIEVEAPEDFKDFFDNYNSYQLLDGELTKSEERQALIDAEKELDYLRELRQVICFPYINRGYLWYKRLNESQQQELEEWYSDWLNVTETKQVPQMPDWLSNY